MARKKKEDKITPIDLNQSNVELSRAVGEITRDAYIFYGGYVNNFRAICGLDGLKISYRRLIYTAMGFPKGKLNPSLTLISSISQFHPHGVQSLDGVNSTLVKSGIFKGRGFFGSTSMSLYSPTGKVVSDPAASRYLQSGLSDLYWELLGDTIKEVDFVPSPQEKMEPTYIPLPIPVALFMSTQVEGLGVGTRVKYPTFEIKSLYEAYKNDNPLLLKSKSDFLIDYENSELQRLWETGKGRVIYSYKISRQLSPDGKTEGILFETKDGTDMFTPNFKKFKKLVDEGKVYGEDLSDADGEKYFIGRVPGARGITIDDIENIARKCCYDDTTYSLMVTDGKSCFRIPLRDWIKFTYERYIGLVTKVNQKKIDKTTFDIAVLEAIPSISDYILNKNPKATDEEISVMLGIPQEIVSSVMSKPISYLRKNKDTSDRIKELKTKLKELKKFDPVAYTEQIINQL